MVKQADIEDFEPGVEVADEETEPMVRVPVGLMHLLFKRMALSVHEHGNLRDGATARVCNETFPAARRKELCEMCFGVSRVTGHMVRKWAGEAKGRRRK